MLDAHYAGASSASTPQYGFGVNSSSPGLAQTFTAETSGQLTSYSIFAIPYGAGTPNTLTVALTTTVAGSPNGGSVLAQQQLNTANVASAGFYSFDVSADAVEVTAGDSYALLITTAAIQPSASIGGDSPVMYVGGDTYFGTPGSLRATNPQTELYFQTFVDPSASAVPANVPEPASAALLGMSLLGFGLLRQRQRT